MHPTTNRAYLFTEEQWRRLRASASRCNEMIERMGNSDLPRELMAAVDAGVEINDEAAVQALADMPNTPAEDQGDLAARNEEMVHDLTLDVGEVVNASQVATQEYDGTDSLEYALFGGRDLVEASLLRGSLSQRMDDFYNQV